MTAAPRNRVLVWGGIASIAAFALAAVILVALPNPAGGVLVVALSLIILGEGIGLIADWRGGRTEVVRIIRGPADTESYVALYLGKAWFIGGVLGPALVIYSAILLFGAARSF